MMSSLFKNVIPLVEIPVDCVHGDTPNTNALRELRNKCMRVEGYFLVELDAESSFKAQFHLGGKFNGRWILGRIAEIQVPITQAGGGTKEVTRYSIYLFFGEDTVEMYCRTPKEVVYAIEDLRIMGISSVFESTSPWDYAEEDVFFQKGFTKTEPDLLVSMAFSRGNYSG